MRKIIYSLLIISIVLGQYILPLSIFASNENRSINEKKLEQVNTIKKANKIPSNETLSPNEKNLERYVVFVKDESGEETKKDLSKKGVAFNFYDNNTYGKVKALSINLSHMSSSQKEDFFEKLDKDENVIAISSVAKREIKAVPSFNDPLWPTDLTYNTSKQWYLSQPGNGNFGIDILRAWQHIDTLGKNYGGSSNVLVAVIDTGASFETYSKYDQYNKMTTPTAWSFTKGTDFTDNIFNNELETANNQLDEDSFELAGYCLDNNEDGDCDTGEYPSVFDDKNSFNVIDWNNYWSRISFSEYSNAPVCTNEPYLSNGIRCIKNYTNTSYCSTNGLSNYMYYGCFESDMGHANDSNGHGTFVSNIISAKGNNGISGVGIAPNISLLPIKIFGESYDTFRSAWVYDSAYGDQIAAAINYAVDKGADIINMSFAGDTIDLYEKMAIDNAYYDEGVLLVAASGNSGTTNQNYPAGYESVMSVGASNMTGGRVSYSSYGSKLDLVAPVSSGIVSQGMWDTVNNKGITANCSWNSSLDCMNVNPMSTPSPFATFANITASGTSFAAPQVVAVAALVKSVYPNMSASQIRYVLNMSAMPLGSQTFSSSTGHGVLNAYNAVRAVDYRGKSLNTNNRILQSTINSSGYMVTRYSDEMGSKWSSWIQSGNIGSKGLYTTLSVPNNSSMLVQVMKGSNNGVYTRYANNYGFINANDSTWSTWQFHGYTTGSISSTISGNNIAIAWRGTNNKVYTRYTNSGTTWNWSGLSTFKPIGNVVMVHDSTNNRLLQLVRYTNNYIYTRTSNDNGINWTGWIRSLDIVATDPSAIFVDGRIVRAVRLYPSNIIITRYSTNGGLTWVGRNRTYGSTGLSNTGISLMEIPQSNYIFQSYRGLNNRIYTRYSSDNGNSWSVQTQGVALPSGYTSLTGAYTVNAGGTLVQMIKTNDGYLRYRRSSNNGISWNNWSKTGSMKISGNISLYYENDLDRVFLSVRGLNGYQYSRVSDDKGRYYTAWQLGSVINNSVITNSFKTNDIDLSN